LEVARHGADRHALVELVPLRQLGDRVGPADALARLDLADAALHLVVGRVSRLGALGIAGLLRQVGLDRLDADHLGIDGGHRAEHALARQVVLIHPQAGQAGVAGEDRQLPVEGLALDPLEQVVRRAPRDDELAGPFDDRVVDRPHAVVGPGLDALAHRVVEHDRDVRLVQIELRAALGLELFLAQVGRDEGEVLAGDAVALGRVAVAPVGERGLALATGDQDDIAADLLGQVLLEDAAVVDLYALDHKWPPTRAADAPRPAGRARLPRVRQRGGTPCAAAPGDVVPSGLFLPALPPNALAAAVRRNWTDGRTNSLDDTLPSAGCQVLPSGCAAGSGRGPPRRPPPRPWPR